MESGKALDEESVLRMKEDLGGISDPRRQWGHLSSMFIIIFHGSSFGPAEDTHHTFCNTTARRCFCGGKSTRHH